ncbi:MAG TPA: ABC transporter substrate-binding protein [Candidatus Eisenbacteria bacterium]|nr:ABC transporter substrate-binding protein [Candidatus Eisenbacteria bacterium]
MAVVTCVLVGACGGSANEKVSCAKAATSATACGSIAGLYAAAKAEGQVNVIGLAPDWVNYGAIIENFKVAFPGIQVNSANPNAFSQEEIDAVKVRGSGAPDVVDLGLKVALANDSLFAPYKVASWDDIPASLKAPTGAWFSSYGGYMGIGYDSARVPGGTITSVSDLLGPGYKGRVALPGDPTKSNQALNALIMASVANGGSIDDVSKGVDFFHRLKVAGNFVPGAATIATVKSGKASVLFEWDYVSAPHVKDVSGWSIFVPSNAIIGGYYTQAVNKAAPHPAAARLWEEYLFSDLGQSLWLKGGAHPVRQAAMEKSGQIDANATAALPRVKGTVSFPTGEQQAAAATYALSHWSQAIA